MNKSGMYSTVGTALMVMSAILQFMPSLTPFGHAHKMIFDVAFYVTLGFGTALVVASASKRKKAE